MLRALGPRVLRYSQNEAAGEGKALGLITIVNQDPVRYTQKKEFQRRGSVSRGGIHSHRGDKLGGLSMFHLPLYRLCEGS